MRVRHTELFLVRHGQTDSNVRGLFHGQTDVPLNEIGIRQAALVARRLLEIETLSGIHSSPLQRALRTAQAIAAGTALRPRLQPGLAEINFGDAEGLTIDALRQRYAWVMERFADPADHDVAFPGGETRSAFHRRVRDTLDSIASEHRGERVVVVAHGGVISSAVAQMLGEDPSDWRKYQVANCSVTHIELASSGPIVHVVNDVVHLEALDVDVVVKG